jgi:histidine triad (HIT) family protein
MPASCVFCAIVAGKEPGSIAYQDAYVIALMDLGQFETNPGNVLVMPKRHIVDIFELDDETGSAPMAATARIANALRNAFGAEGVNLAVANGEAAGQEVMHLHIHVFPRRKGDSFVMRYYESFPNLAERSELDRQAAAIRAVLVH